MTVCVNRFLLKNNVIFISFPHYGYQKVSSGRYKICWNRILITNKEIQLSAADGAKATAEEFEIVVPERRHLLQHPKSSSAWNMMTVMMIVMVPVTV
jgi:hypothetical protein